LLLQYKTNMSNTKPKLSIKQLFSNIKESFAQTIDENLVSNLELVEYQKTSNGYEITVSYYVIIPSSSGLSSFRPPIKSYKTFLLNDQGEVEKIEVHEFSR
jgi:hypothetical protein